MVAIELDLPTKLLELLDESSIDKMDGTLVNTWFWLFEGNPECWSERSETIAPNQQKSIYLSATVKGLSLV